jgi:hypothetical protein
MSAQPSLKIDTKSLAADLARDGIVVLPNFVSGAKLESIQKTFATMLKRMRWNDFAGYEKTEPFRHMIQDILTLDQGFVDCVLDQTVKATLNDYIGDGYALVEAKGWLSNPTTVDFNGWHGDCWYDQNKITEYVPREVKLAVYLTDVESGYFNYVKGTHGKNPRFRVPNWEVEAMKNAEIVQVKGAAGTAFMFDTSGIHRQSVPILKHRQAVFYNFHDPSIPLQEEDVKYYRYHPIQLNAAFLGALDSDDMRILGFGDKRNFVLHFERGARDERFQKFMASTYSAKMRMDRLNSRIRARINRMMTSKH